MIDQIKQLWTHLWTPVIQSITWNVVGGFLTVWLMMLYWSFDAKRRRKFKAIFGHHVKSCSMCYGALVLDETVKELLSVDPDLQRFPLAKKSNRRFRFSAESTASACEIRAASYIASALGRDGGISTQFVSDDNSAGSSFDLDFISFGALSNDKTVQLFSNEANDLAEYDPAQQFFVWKKDRQLLCTPRAGFDYGLIIKIHPKEFPNRTWIACAGLGEWGTSGSAWFLAKKWLELESHFHAHDRFAAVIRVESKKDESAKLDFSISR